MFILFNTTIIEAANKNKRLDIIKVYLIELSPSVIFLDQTLLVETQLACEKQ